MISSGQDQRQREARAACTVQQLSTLACKNLGRHLPSVSNQGKSGQNYALQNSCVWWCGSAVAVLRIIYSIYIAWLYMHKLVHWLPKKALRSISFISDLILCTHWFPKNRVLILKGKITQRLAESMEPGMFNTFSNKWVIFLLNILSKRSIPRDYTASKKSEGI